MGLAVALSLIIFSSLIFSNIQGSRSYPKYLGDDNEFLGGHNAVRASVGVRPLTWSYELEAYARRYADRRRVDCRLVHSKGGRYGENIFEGSEEYTSAYAVADWASERQYYDYDSNSCVGGQMCGHYTQVVWSNTAYLGCARVTCEDGDTFITCNYDPPGNVDGVRPY